MKEKFFEAFKRRFGQEAEIDKGSVVELAHDVYLCVFTTAGHKLILIMNLESPISEESVIVLSYSPLLRDWSAQNIREI